MSDRKNLVRLVFCIGLFHIAGYYLAGTLSSLDGGIALPQPDTLLYCQAARQIAEGSPFSFSFGSTPCTGTTSVLYPFVLAIPYALGCTGTSLLTAGFVLNACFYLVFLIGWVNAICHLLDRSLARLLSAFLLAFEGQPAYCSFAQSDIGCWLALSGLLAWGFASERRWLYGAVLILSPWFRPEGMICVIAFVTIVVLLKAMAWKGLVPVSWRPSQSDFIIIGLSVFSSMGVFVLNSLLTGNCQFSSVAQKGYFSLFPFPDAVCRVACDFVTILRELVLGLAGSKPRVFATVPLIGGIAFVLGISVFHWVKLSSRWLSFLILASLGGIVTVSNSGWQGSNYDRYLAWVMPLICIFCSVGVDFLSSRLEANRRLKILPSLFILFAMLGSVASISIFASASRACERPRAFARECESILPHGSSVGMSGYVGLSYELSPRRCAHLPGIYSPEFHTRFGVPGIVEILQNEPQTRFEYWLERFTDYNQYVGDSAAEESVILTGPDGFVLARADWSIYDGLPSPECLPEGLELADRVDVAYERDENRCRYEVIDRYARTDFLPFYRIDKLGNRNVIESGRVLVGGDAMTVSLQTNRAVTVVMRTCARQVATIVSSGRTDEFAFTNPLSLRVDVDGREIDVFSISYATNGFSDVRMTIPAAAITRPSSRISFLGDHVACCYWFYQ